VQFSDADRALAAKRLVLISTNNFTFCRSNGRFGRGQARPENRLAVKTDAPHFVDTLIGLVRATSKFVSTVLMQRKSLQQRLSDDLRKEAEGWLKALRENDRKRASVCNACILRTEDWK